MIRRINSRSDEGAILVVAMLVLVAVGLISTALLTQATSSVRNSVNLQEYDERVFAADAGVRYAIRRLRSDDTVCSAPPAIAGTTEQVSGASDPLVVNGHNVTVECETQQGRAGGLNGFALVTTFDGARSLETGGGQAKSIEGPVFVTGGIDLGKPLTIAGNFAQKTPCTPDTWPDVSPAGLYARSCSPSAFPLVAPALETAPLGQPAFTDVSTANSACRIFSPGTYTSYPQLDETGRINYFRSGAYLFDFPGNYTTAVWPIKHAVILGGVPASEDGVALAVPRPDCANDTGSTGKGVTFMFTKKSHIDFDAGAHMELFSREKADGTVLPSMATTAGSTLNENEDLLVPKSGNTPDLVLHGAYYAPRAKLTLVPTNTVNSAFLSGIATGKMLISDSGSATGLRVSTRTTTGRRLIRITSTVPAANGARAYVSNAVVEIRNDAGRTTTVQSWRTI